MTELFFNFGVDFSFNCITGAELIKQKEETPRGFKVIQVKFHYFIFKYKQLEVFCIKAACDQVIYALKKIPKFPNVCITFGYKHPESDRLQKFT